MFERFQNFMDRAASQYGIKTEVQAAQVCSCFRNVMGEMMREEVKEFVDAGSFSKGVLVVNVANPGWGQEVVMKKEQIIKAMNEKLGEEKVKNLRTQVGNFQGL